MPLISALVLVMAVDAVRRKRKALVSSRAGLSGGMVRDDIVVKVDGIILEGGFLNWREVDIWFWDLLQGCLPSYMKSLVQQG